MHPNHQAAINLLQELEERKLLADITNQTKLINALVENKAIYIGFDPTATSLHLGNYIGIKILRHFQKYGFKTVAVLGGATGLIGDPSFKNSERKLLDENTINHNKKHISQQLIQLAQCDQVVDNLEFYQSMNVIGFLRDVGKLINVNYLLDKDALKERLKTGLSYTEFTYPLIQGWDFLQLFENYDVAIQAGGSDQWGNITTGIEIIRKIKGEKTNLAGLTFNLLTDYLGNKFGKSENNALFLDPKLTHPYKIYQFLLNSADADVEKYLLSLTFIPVQKIHTICAEHSKNLALRHGQKTLAHTLISEIYGSVQADACAQLSAKIFNNDLTNLQDNDYLALSQVLKTIEIEVATSILEVLVQLELTTSLTNARKLIQSQGISVQNEKILTENFMIQASNYEQAFLLVKKGKKNYGLIRFRK